VDGDRRDFRTLLAIMDRLRNPDGGCPWDLEQDVHTLKKYLLEEVYEALDAIDREDWDDLAEELGDVLLEVVFLAKVCQQAGRFAIGDAIEHITTKLIRRHPHIFAGDEARDAEAVFRRWHRLKMEERGTSMAGILDTIPRELPALLRAYRLSERVSKVGFDWDAVEPVLAKYDEEWEEFRAARASGDAAKMEEEFGDLLFTLVNVGRFLHLSAEDALRRANEKFARRFRVVEQEFARSGQAMEDAGIAALEEAWQRAKRTTG
jgi:ATP diphosphatase